MVKQPKPKKCKVCKTSFTPDRPLQQVCNYQCAIELANDRKDRLERTRKAQVRRSDKERLKTRADHLREAQAVFNSFIRERDKGQPCISCKRHHNGQYHAGHYRSIGACPELRFEPDNVHLQCSVCNNHRSGNLIEYRINLAQKVGIERLSWLEGPHNPKKYTIDDIKAIKQAYKQRLINLRKTDS